MTRKISAIVLAAGESRRMGQPKLVMPWGDSTILGQVIATFAGAGIEDILVVTGGARQQIEQAVAQLVKSYPVRTIHNPDYAHGEMVSSIQFGLKGLGSECPAALIGLGDQPQIREETVSRIVAVFLRTGCPLVIPSFEGRRGHPWLAARSLWPELLALPASTTPRQFLNSHAAQIEYTAADESILKDLDTLDDYSHQRP